MSNNKSEYKVDFHLSLSKKLSIIKSYYKIAKISINEKSKKYENFCNYTLNVTKDKFIKNLIKKDKRRSRFSSLISPFYFFGGLVAMSYFLLATDGLFLSIFGLAGIIFLSAVLRKGTKKLYTKLTVKNKNKDINALFNNGSELKSIPLLTLLQINILGYDKTSRNFEPLYKAFDYSFEFINGNKKTRYFNDKSVDLDVNLHRLVQFLLLKDLNTSEELKDILNAVLDKYNMFFIELFKYTCSVNDLKNNQSFLDIYYSMTEKLLEELETIDDIIETNKELSEKAVISSLNILKESMESVDKYNNVEKEHTEKVLNSIKIENLIKR